MEGYSKPFTCNSRTGRWAVPARVGGSEVASEVRQAKEKSLRVRGCRLFNLLPAILRNADHGDVLMFKNNLDHFLSCVYQTSQLYKDLEDQPERIA